jgi:putative Mn2+ efflux pump MntP
MIQGAELLALAVGLAMDATAVAAARGIAAPTVRVRDGLMVGLLFGGAQAVMPLAGWAIGDWIGPVVSAWDHWIAFSLLAALGVKMLWEARRTTGSATTGRRGDPFALGPLLVLAIATSLDAFAVGITLPLLGAPFALSLVTIGVTTAVLSGAAVFLGRRFAAHLGRRLDTVGGLVLIALGVKILVEHLRAG